MDERPKFIASRLDGEQMAGLCREFGISRKTGYKILTRYNKVGLEGLTENDKAVHSSPPCAKERGISIPCECGRLSAVASIIAVRAAWAEFPEGRW
jgi:hypothetical protein